MVQAFTYTEAQDIAGDFEDIVDTEYIKSGIKAVIDNVIICPYHFITQYATLMEYYNGDEAKLPVEDEPGALYAVLVVMSSLDNDAIIIQDITAYVEDNGINYNFPA